jgi:hypothetical protein
MVTDATWVAAVASLVILALIVYLVVARVAARSPDHVIKIKLLFVTIYSAKSASLHPDGPPSEANCKSDHLPPNRQRRRWQRTPRT